MLESYVLKVRGGADTYIKRDGKVGTAGKGALIESEVAFTLAATQDQTLITMVEHDDGTAEAMAVTIHDGSRWIVRRLTPVECERLMGFSDGYTDIPYKGKEHPPDTPRYKSLGNSFAVPVVRWIGERMQMVDEIISKQQQGGFDGRPDS